MQMPRSNVLMVYSCLASEDAAWLHLRHSYMGAKSVMGALIMG